VARKKVVINPIVGERIKKLRKEKKISQTELAQKLNYETGNTVLYWENGRSSVPADILDQLADIFDVSIYYLLGKTDTKINWAKYDEEHQEILSAIEKANQFEDYLKSIGFGIEVKPHGESAIYILSRNEKSIEISAEAFEAFQESIENYIQFEFFKLNERKE